MTDCGPQADARPTPVHVITGFLGSGKTTLLNRLVNCPEMSDTAVIINEFGEIGIDHWLVDTMFEDAVLLRSGCLCCSIRGDLIDTLSDLANRRKSGIIPNFRRVVIETTGLADPAPILRTLMGDLGFLEQFRLGDVVTTVDAVHGLGQLENHVEPVKQAAVADTIILTKIDIASPVDREKLVDRLGRINPVSVILPVVNGEISPDKLFGAGLQDRPSRRSDIREWLLAGSDNEEGGDTHLHEHLHDQDGSANDHDVNRHSDDIRSFWLIHDLPVEWAAFRAWLEAIASLRGAHLLRVKGIVNVTGINGPVVIHGVQHLFHPPVELDGWPSSDHRTRIVFITQGLDLGNLQGALAALKPSAIESKRTGSNSVIAPLRHGIEHRLGDSGGALT
jgi:G3E family GTPase